MVEKTVRITNPSGLHLRPAGIFCNEAVKFKSKVTFRYGRGDSTANAKSVLGVLGACVKAGDEITLMCEGDDEKEALDSLVALVESGFGEKIE